VDGVIPQLQMFLLGGHILISNVLVKIILLATVALGSCLHPTLKLAGLPMFTWLLCVGFLIVEIPFLTLACGMSVGDLLQSYNAYYLLLLIGPVLLVFQDAVSERIMMRWIVLLLFVCAAIGVAQYVTAKPILYTESADGGFAILSWDFFGDVRAFSLFTSGLSFGIFCAFCGALGVALSRTLPTRGTLVVIVSALACFTTLTRLCYLVFFCACTYAVVLTFGRRRTRGLLLPLLFAALGIATIAFGLNSIASGGATNLQDVGSTLMRVDEWTYYFNLLIHATLAHQLFGFGIVQNEKLISSAPMAIDNVPLALIMHIGIVGLALFGVLLIKMWLYLRREALSTQQPLLIAAASLWATFACASIFNIVFGSFGAVFALVILCKRESVMKQHTSP